MSTRGGDTGTIVFVDVGQGDCTLVVDASSGSAVLIDCPAGQSRQALKHLQGSGAHSIELAVVTHSDWDHIGGVFEVLDLFPTMELRLNLDTKMTPDQQEKAKVRSAQRSFLGLIDRGVDIKPAYAGDFGHVGDIAWRFLSPTHPLLLEAQSRRERNVASVVVRLSIETTEALVTGDTDSRAWRKILDGPEELQADVLRLPHHGGSMSGSDASLEELLQAVGASLHVISVGSNNTYGHPHPDIFDSLAANALHARVICTQMTDACRGTADWPVETALGQLPISSVQHRRHDSGGCPCGGTITVRICRDGYAVSPSPQEHGQVISAVESPMCHRQLAASNGSSAQRPTEI